MNLYVPGRLYSLQNKPDLRWVMQSYDQGGYSQTVQHISPGTRTTMPGLHAFVLMLRRLTYISKSLLRYCDNVWKGCIRTRNEHGIDYRSTVIDDLFNQHSHLLLELGQSRI